MIVYVVTNKLNGKRYVGQSSRTMEHRWQFHLEDVRKGSRTYFHNAIRKNGADAFTMEVLLTSDKVEVIDHCERTFIEFYQTNQREKGYNLTSWTGPRAENPEGNSK